MRTLYAGYWLGEFGWELMRWQARVRAVARDYDRVVIGCESGHEYLYQDFATEFVTYEGDIRRRNMWLMDSGVRSLDYFAHGSGRCITPSETFCTKDRAEEWVRYGCASVDVPCFTALFHARSTDNMQTGYRNYPVELWEEIARKFPLSASIGTIDGASHIPGTADLRGVPLKTLADLMHEARVVVGPSSGPMHLASLCGTPHVVWSKERREVIGHTNRERYERAWNPFNTQCMFISSQCPEPSEVLRCLSQFA